MSGDWSSDVCSSDLNGIGNYSIEPETRNRERMDLVFYYKGEPPVRTQRYFIGRQAAAPRP